MNLPFTETQFFDVLGAYNLALWPLEAALWIVTLAIAVRLVLGGGSAAGALGVAAVLWIVSGAVYHALFFAAINPAARGFALFFVVEGLGLLWLATTRAVYRWRGGPRQILGIVFLGYSLLYPALSLATGHSYPRAPLFAVPCPTMLFTAGLLLAIDPVPPMALFVVPILWGGLGLSAALTFHVAPDFMLPIAAASLLVYGIAVVLHRTPARIGG